MIDRAIIAYAYAVIGLGCVMAIGINVMVILRVAHIGW